MAFSSLLSSSLRLRRLISIVRSPTNLNFGGARTMTTSTTVVNSPPWLMLPPGGDTVYNFYSLAQNKVVSFNNTAPPISLTDTTTEIVGSSHGWLALFNDNSYDLFLSNPITGRHLKLPPIPSESIDRQAVKVIISCDDAESEECRAMMIFNPLDSLAFCCPARSTKWTPIGSLKRPPEFECWRGYDDIVYSSRDKLFFCLADMDSHDLEGWDVSDPHSPRLRWSNHDMLGRDNYLAWLHPPLDKEGKSFSFSHTPGFGCVPLRYLVTPPEQSGQLFLVTRHLAEAMARDGSQVDDLDSDYDCWSYPYKTIAFDVHKINWEEGGGGKLSYMEGGSLDGLAMFVGLGHSFAMSAADHHQLKPDSIYFTDHWKATPLNSYTDAAYGGHDIGVFDYANRTISPCYYPCEPHSFKRIKPAPIWFTPSHPKSLQ